MTDRTVVLIDMDCFYCQVETRLNPSLTGKPIAVVQYNASTNGGLIIAVNYEARAFGVSRQTKGSEAKKMCPNIELVKVPALRGKADLTKYRDAGREVVKVLTRFCDCVERASVDEAFLDVTQVVEQKRQGAQEVDASLLNNTFVVGFTSTENNDEGQRREGVTEWLQSVYHSGLKDPAQDKLAMAAMLVEEIRAAVFTETGFRCSAGIGHNKVLAKLVCALHKPNRQTVLPHPSVAEFYRTLSIKKIRSLGGKFGDSVVQTLGCSVMADLAQYSLTELQHTFDDKSGIWLFNIARGIDNEPVTPRLVSKSIGCCKKFPGNQALKTKDAVLHWLLELATEVAERLVQDMEQNKRRATLMTVSYSQGAPASRSGHIMAYEAQQMAAEALEIIKKVNSAPPNQNFWHPPLFFLGISVGKFVDISSRTSTIDNFFKAAQKCEEPISEQKVTRNQEPEIHVGAECEPSRDKNGKNPFFINYFKQHKTALEDNVENPSENKGRPRNVAEREESNSVSSMSRGELQTGGKEGAYNRCQAFNPCQGVMSMSNAAAGTDSKDKWIGLEELFPNSSQVDETVVDLLPSPLRRRVLAKISEKKQTLSKMKEAEVQDTKTGSCVNSPTGNEANNWNPSPDLFDIEDKMPTVVDNLPHQSLKVGQPDDVERRNGEGLAEKSRTDLKDDHVRRNVFSNHNDHQHFVGNNNKRKTERSDFGLTHLQEENSNELLEFDLQKGNSSSITDCNAGPMKCETSSKNTSLYSVRVPALGEHSVTGCNLNLSSLVVSGTETCPTCKQSVAAAEFAEHLDYHVAEELDLLLNSTGPPINQHDYLVAQELDKLMNSAGTSSKPPVRVGDRLKNSTRSPARGTSSKRKRGGKNGRKDKKLRSVTAFFNPK